MQWKKVAGVAGILLAGALGGAVAATVLARGEAQSDLPDSPGQHVSDKRHRPNGDGALDRLRREQQELRRRLEAVEVQSDSGAEAGVHEHPSAAPSAFDMEHETQVLRSRHEEWRRRHANEHRDAAWAREKEAAFSAALGATAEPGGYKILQVDCRTTLRTTELEWPSYTLASNGYKLALHLDVPGCESAIMLEPPVDGSRPYRATARYDCETARTGDER